MAIDNPFVRVNLGWRKSHFIGVVIAGGGDARQNLAHFRLVIDELQQRLARGALATDAKNIFGGRIEVDDEKVLVEQYDARTETVENAAGVVLQRSVAGIAVA